MPKNSWETRHTGSLTGKTVAITGATGGLGREICRDVLRLGGNLILLNRNPDKTHALQKELLSSFPQASLSSLTVDLTDIESVRAVCTQLKAMPVDILIHNAGAYSVPRKTCTTGLDNVFQTNFMSPYYITRQLLPTLEKRGGKIVAVGSIAHTYSKTDPQDIDFAGRSRASLVYGNSKRYLMYALWELMKEHPCVKLSIAHPGITFTNITAHYPKVLFAIIKWPMKVIFMRPAKAARSVMQGVFEEIPTYHWVGPRIFNIWGNPAVKKVNTADETERLRIFAAAQRLYADIEKAQASHSDI